MTRLGKTVGQRHYVHSSRIDELEPTLSELVVRAKSVIESRQEVTYNVVRIDPVHDEVAFLYYPQLGLETFHTLGQSWLVHLPSELVTHRKNDASLTPPILHRTELILPPDHPAQD